MVIDEIAVHRAIANIGDRFDRLPHPANCQYREAACKQAKSGAPCGSEGTMRRQGFDGDTASASVDHRSVDRKAELRSGSDKPVRLHNPA